VDARVISASFVPEVGPWAEDKLECLRKYLSAYTTMVRTTDMVRTTEKGRFGAMAEVELSCCRAMPHSGRTAVLSNYTPVPRV
jgi:hypothetical protein